MPEHISQNSQNVAPVKEIHAHSTFDLDHYIFGTHRFANYNVNFARECVGGDSFPVRSADNIDSYTLRAPLMQDVQKTKEYFFVPKQCLMPINWDKIERLPALGDDVDASLVNSTVNFKTHISAFQSFINFRFPADTESTYENCKTYVNRYIRKLLFSELFFSQGSLLASSGCHLSGLIADIYDSSNDVHYNQFDLYFDSVISALVACGNLKFFPDTASDWFYIVNPTNDIDSRGVISSHRMLELMRDNYSWEIQIDSSAAASRTALIALSSRLDDVSFTFYSDTECKFSLDRCAAYQIVCAHYFSNDSIDYIHDADLWRENMQSIIDLFTRQFINNAGYSYFYFLYNGVRTLYDCISARWFSSILEYLLASFDTRSSGCGYFVNLLGWRRSLRFGDYFVGAKARPLAPGDFSVAVNDGAVSVIDVTKKISLQRLANNVNRIGNSIKEWYRKIMGSDLAYDYHNPMWLASTRSTVYAVKNENTNNADISSLGQVTTSANFVGRDSDYEFNFHPDRNGVIIGITYYDIRRSYSLGIDRMLQHVDRFDGFIPDMQYIGDQDIRQNEIVVSAGESPLAYTLRNMEYKQYHDEAYGAFAVGMLPGYAFLYEPSYARSADGDDTPYFRDVISPEFIRSRCDEFDQFYVSLTGFSNATYFHFIVKTYNNLQASRPMVFAPQIL